MAQRTAPAAEERVAARPPARIPPPPPAPRASSPELSEFLLTEYGVIKDFYIASEQNLTRRGNLYFPLLGFLAALFASAQALLDPPAHLWVASLLVFAVAIAGWDLYGLTAWHLMETIEFSRAMNDLKKNVLELSPSVQEHVHFLHADDRYSTMKLEIGIWRSVFVLKPLPGPARIVSIVTPLSILLLLIMLLPNLDDRTYSLLILHLSIPALQEPWIIAISVLCGLLAYMSQNGYFRFWLRRVLVKSQEKSHISAEQVKEPVII